MINLLPPDVKENYRYARKNTILVKAAIGVFIGVFGIVLVTIGGWMFLDRSTAAYTGLVNDTETQLKTNKLDQAQGQIDGISNNLKLVVKVLSKEILFSQLLTQIGKALPSGTVLINLNITNVDGGLDLQAASVDYQTASQIQVNLEDPSNKLFSKADIVSIQCQASITGGDALSATYPCKADIRAQFTTNNPFLFINSTSSTKAGSQ